MVPAGDHPAQIAGAVDAEHRLIAILFDNAAQLGSNRVQGLIPRYAFESPLSALADPLEGMQKTLF